jgi:cold-inducible RNA-binding protein
MKNKFLEDFMNTKIYVGNLPQNFKESDVRALFDTYGSVQDVKLINDRDTGMFRGFGFIEMASKKEAELAIEKLDGSQIENNTIKVNYAREKEDNFRNSNRGGFRSGGGSRGGSGRY